MSQLASSSTFFTNLARGRTWLQRERITSTIMAKVKQGSRGSTTPCAALYMPTSRDLRNTPAPHKANESREVPWVLSTGNRRRMKLDLFYTGKVADEIDGKGRRNIVEDNAKMLVPGPAKKPTASPERWKHDLYGPSFVLRFLPDPDLAAQVHVRCDQICANFSFIVIYLLQQFI
uniref:Uncharacterized protein n=1 Tax=Vespula pensylvanica TaxID=30213 RepID=A0A834KCN0_VESPE|nr:hypothetical protein H0235_014936 [Vespula pensylvanica]